MDTIFLENEREANWYSCRCLQVMALIAALAWVLNLLDVFIVPPAVMNVGMPVCIFFFLLPTMLCAKMTRLGGRFKYLIMGCCILGITVLSIAIPKHTVLAWIAPVLLSCHYYSRTLTASALTASVVCLYVAGVASLFMGEGDPNLIKAFHMEEAVITPEIFGEAVLFFLLPRSAILVGMAFVCIIVAKRTRSLLEKQAADSSARQRIETELNVATQIQADMLPRIFPAFPERREFDIYASMTPAKEVGGDFYDFFLVDNDHLAMVIADVSGKGVPAALFMVITKTLLKNAVQTGLSPKAALEKVNNQLCENNEAEMFVTVWLGIYEISTGKLTAANAGHEYPALRRANGQFELWKDRHGFVLAGMENVQYQEYELEIGVGDTLFVYTDGVAEATDAANTLYGTDRMLAALNQNCDLDPEKLLHQVKTNIDRFVGSAPQFDDITMLSLQRKGSVGRRSIQVAPILESIPQVCEFLERVLKEQGTPMKVITQMNIAADEICSNIARYSGAAAAQVDCELMDGRTVIHFADDGKPYDPTVQKEPDITLSAEERENGGLGIFMVKKSMDRVAYEYADGRNILTIEKHW
ncbi:SpoIIE family protein phosphatase [Agathobaculum sp. Marseille-P7918]|uniref:ATP-binding SpoIIE family protein phosphatase n=1 Tax=Agathobaculum sp. Marseille-P7918 TaxID=2479843 RepID=UPI003568CD8D